MIKIWIEIDGKIESTEITEKTYGFLQDGAIIRNRPIKWFLNQIVKNYGELTEENILKFIEEKWII
ncbi:MAG: hypothetical protein A3I24_02495 [Candidatus Harrisonbacteria bacterium RIFCSPLOWO2_02_FULL_41_13b]|uniref:Uncharacterized protein n=1 Tax=Candidatus Harrisonbacteria bacterium RIFCSPLOWO2_02_FULL_41_13b TaxID=1798409 RepID=A0A1G1ZVH1_9BACT|nr:MAG: hypothetical protein A3J53_02450 [Candidatus Harrisonbacteria bacterium RIFCSPHIGHO2_02_FULL_40_20]OGY68116.1 MAG: hypothetical protein A3I24_02495 [Candidatus Harrisonbacteria bacterium RIFCSPLOWO2_02_FULL_41_13b]